MRKCWSILLAVIVSLASTGCVAKQDQFLMGESDVLKLSVDQLTEYYDVSEFAGTPRVIEGFFGKKHSEGVSIDVVDTWEANHDTALELLLPQGQTVEDYSKVYCIVVDNNTTCDFSDDILVHYWLISEK